MTFTSLHFNHLKYAIQWHLIHSQWQLSLYSLCTIFITLKENLVLIKQPLHALPFLQTVEATNLFSAHAYVLVLSRFSHVRLFATLWTVAHQAHPSMGISRQGYWSGLPCSPPGDLPNPGIEPRSPTSQADSLLSEPPRKSITKGDIGYVQV